MDNSMLIGLQTQRVLQRRLEIAANNLANVATAGFKADDALFAVETPPEASSQDAPSDVRFVRDIGELRDMRQGVIKRTQEPFDLAIQGNGFFMVQGANGETLYTRDGEFKMGAGGALLTSEGAPVLAQGGGPVTIETQGETPSIGADGSIRVGETALGQIGVASFERPGALVKVGDNLFAAGGQQPGAFAGEIVQGAVEESNVSAVIELTQLIEITRAYESAARMVKQSDDLRRAAIEKLGQAA